MQNISLDYAKQYLLDRCKELRNQEPNGDPFVFLGIVALLNTVLNLDDVKGVDKSKSLKYIRDRYDTLRDDISWNMINSFALLDQVSLSHNRSDHLTVTDKGRTAFTAICCIEDIESAIEELFDCGTEQESSALYCALNSKKFVGLRD